MTDKAVVRFVDSCKSRKNFIHYLVFKKNQSKDVLDRRKLKWLSITIFTVLLSFSLFQEPAVKKDNVETVIAKLTTETIDVPEANKPKSSTIQRKGKLPPLPGLKMFERQETITSGRKMIVASLLGSTSDGPARALVKKSVDIGAIYITKDSVVLGTANTSNDRLQIEFNKVLLADGESIELKGKAVDAGDRGVGIRGSMNWAKAGKFLAKIGLDFTAGVAEGMKEKEETNNGQIVDKTSAKNAVLNGTSHAAMEAARDKLQAFSSVPDQVSLPDGKIIHIAIEE